MAARVPLRTLGLIAARHGEGICADKFTDPGGGSSRWLGRGSELIETEKAVVRVRIVIVAVRDQPGSRRDRTRPANVHLRYQWKTHPEAKLMRKGFRKEAKLSFADVLMENRNGQGGTLAMP